jgi:hypothetical protein
MQQRDNLLGFFTAYFPGILETILHCASLLPVHVIQGYSSLVQPVEVPRGGVYVLRSVRVGGKA